MKKFLSITFLLIITLVVIKYQVVQSLKKPIIFSDKTERKEKKTAAERQLFTEERLKHEAVICFVKNGTKRYQKINVNKQRLTNIPM